MSFSNLLLFFLQFLQEAPAELQKLISPMFHIRFVQDYLRPFCLETFEVF